MNEVDEHDMMPIPSGELFIATTGEYSDYGVDGVFRAVQELDTYVLIEQYLNEKPQQREADSFEKNEFLAWLIRKNLIEPVDCWIWHLSSWGCVSDMSVNRLAD
jgi:hypothetical protein